MGAATDRNEGRDRDGGRDRDERDDATPRRSVETRIRATNSEHEDVTLCTSAE